MGQNCGRGPFVPTVDPKQLSIAASRSIIAAMGDLLKLIWYAVAGLFRSRGLVNRPETIIRWSAFSVPFSCRVTVSKISLKGQGPRLVLPLARRFACGILQIVEGDRRRCVAPIPATWPEERTSTKGLRLAAAYVSTGRSVPAPL
jgi:hypothetical protein